MNVIFFISIYHLLIPIIPKKERKNKLESFLIGKEKFFFYFYFIIILVFFSYRKNLSNKKSKNEKFFFVQNQKEMFEKIRRKFKALHDKKNLKE